MNQAQFLKRIARTMKRYPTHSQESEVDPVFVMKLFDIAGSWTWYLTEYDPETHIAFGYVTGLAYDEWWSFSIDELMTLRWLSIPRIEIDRWFPKTLSSKVINSNDS